MSSLKPISPQEWESLVDDYQTNSTQRLQKWPSLNYTGVSLLDLSLSRLSGKISVSLSNSIPLSSLRSTCNLAFKKIKNLRFVNWESGTDSSCPCGIVQAPRIWEAVKAPVINVRTCATDWKILTQNGDCYIF